MRIASSLVALGGGEIAGHAVDFDEPDRVLVVDILIDDVPFATVRADRQIPELGEDVGDHAFCVALPEAALGEPCRVEARLSNLDLAVGRAIVVAPGGGAAQAEAGAVEWAGGLRIAGWIAEGDGAALSLLVDGVLVDRIRPGAWLGDRDGRRPGRAFSAHLPAGFADGAVHRCAVQTQTGEALRGSPFAILACADGLREVVAGRGLSERDLLRAELFDRLVPASVPFEAGAMMADVEPGAASEDACLVCLIGAPGPAATSIDSLRAQIHGNWSLAVLPAMGGPASFATDALRDALASAPAASLVVFALAGTAFRRPALGAFAAAFAADAGAQAAYADVEVPGTDGVAWPLALPAFDYERLLEQGYCTLLVALRRAAVDHALSMGAADLPALVMALCDGQTAARPAILHLPGIAATLPPFDREAASRTLAASAAAHLARRGIAAGVEPGRGGLLPAARVRRTGRPLRTTVLIPTRNRRDLLEGCLASILPAVTRQGADILVIDNGSTDPDALELLAGLPARGIGLLRDPGPFNFARLINRGAAQARGEALCLLNNDVLALDDTWLAELLRRLSEPDVGAVAPLLTWPSGVVQNAGLVLGPCFEAASPFTDRLAEEPGYGDMLRVARECSAVTAACLVTRRRDFLDLGGLDEVAFPINFNDVDYGLKLREAGRRIVLTPHAVLHHPESSSRGHTWSEDRRRLFARETRNLQWKWGEAIAADPYYHPLLALGPRPYDGLAAGPRRHTPRGNAAPLARDMPEGTT